MCWSSWILSSVDSTEFVTHWSCCLLRMYIELSFVMHCRYHCLVHGQDWNTKQLPNTVCQTILNTQGSVYRDLYRIGATKVRTLGGYLHKIGATKVRTLGGYLYKIGATKVWTLGGYLHKIRATKVRTLGGYLYKIGATKVIWLEVKGIQDLFRIGATKVRKLGVKGVQDLYVIGSTKVSGSGFYCGDSLKRGSFCASERQTSPSLLLPPRDFTLCMIHSICYVSAKTITFYMQVKSLVSLHISWKGFNFHK